MKKELKQELKQEPKKGEKKGEETAVLKDKPNTKLNAEPKDELRNKPKDKPKVELLLPVGNEDSLKAAVENGADAVYLGIDRFNARIGLRILPSKIFLKLPIIVIRTESRFIAP